MSILNNFITVVNPDGTISYFPNTLQSEPGIPFTSTVDMKDMNSGLFSNFDQTFLKNHQLFLQVLFLIVHSFF